MPFYLKDRDVRPALGTVRSALIVACGFCPAASLAVREGRPYLEPLRRFLRTGSYESYIDQQCCRLRSEGIRTEVFGRLSPFPSVMCMWPPRRRKRLARAAKKYEALLVLGCDAAVETAKGCASASGPKVVPGMDIEGIMNVTPTFHVPFNIRLDVNSVTRVLQPPPPRGAGPQ